MRRSLFAIFRGSDGRSLAWALALLLLVNAFVAGANTGFAATPGALLCAIGDAHGSRDAPGGARHGDPCCLAGCVNSAAGAELPATILPLPHTTTGTPVLPNDAVALVLPQPSGHGPRGPPLLA